MNIANQNRQTSIPPMLHEAVIRAQHVLASIETKAPVNELYKTLNDFHESLEQVVTLLSVIETSPFSAAKAMELTRLRRQIDNELTAHECGVRSLRLEQIKDWISTWLAGYFHAGEQEMSLAAE